MLWGVLEVLKLPSESLQPGASAMSLPCVMPGLGINNDHRATVPL